MPLGGRPMGWRACGSPRWRPPALAALLAHPSQGPVRRWLARSIRCGPAVKASVPAGGAGLRASATLAVPISFSTASDGVGTATGGQAVAPKQAQRPASLHAPGPEGPVHPFAIDAGQPGHRLRRQLVSAERAWIDSPTRQAEARVSLTADPQP